MGAKVEASNKSANSKLAKAAKITNFPVEIPLITIGIKKSAARPAKEENDIINPIARELLNVSSKKIGTQYASSASEKKTKNKTAVKKNTFAPHTLAHLYRISIAACYKSSVRARTALSIFIISFISSTDIFQYSLLLLFITSVFC